MSGPVDVSVVIPCYNAAEYLAEQLEALTRQDYAGSWEIVLADNGSTDSSRAIAEGFHGRLPLEVVDASRGRGASFARNAGARHARGRLLAFCDADDVVADDWLRRLLAASGRGDIVAGSYEHTSLNDPALLLARGGVLSGADLPQPLRFLPFAGSGNVLVPRQLLLEMGGWDESYGNCEDVEFCWRAQLAGHSLVYEPDSVIHYRYRASARHFYRQISGYTRAEARLYVQFRQYGAKRRPLSAVLRSVIWVMTRLPYLLMDRRRRYVWVAIAAETVGRVSGSIRERVWCL